MKSCFTIIFTLAVAAATASITSLPANANSADPIEKLLSYKKFVCLKQTGSENPVFRVTARIFDSVTEGQHGELEITKLIDGPQNPSRTLLTSIKVDLESERTLDDGTLLQAASYFFLKEGEGNDVQGLMVQPTLVDAKLSKKFNGWFFESFTRPAKFLSCQGSF